MIEFVTLLIGLTLGSQVVEVTVAPAVERVEFWLDGQSVASLDSPPWRATVDLGASWRPHVLAVTAHGSDGRELGRAEQWINTARSAAEARLLLVPGDDGFPRQARLAWESRDGEPPTSVIVLFDDQRLGLADDPRVVELPEYDRRRLHFVTAELEWRGGVRARAEASFGGRFGSRVATELTAVLVSGVGDVEASDMDGWLRSGDQPLKVVTAEKGRAEVIVVRDRGLEPLLVELRAAGARRPSMRRFGPRQVREEGLRRFDMQLGADDRVQFLWPGMSRKNHPTFVDIGLFDVSARVTAQDGGMFWYLTRLYPHDHEAQGEQRLADAVAVAGRRSAASYARRAVVLALSRRPEEASGQSAQGVRDYLRALQIPLVVWSGRTLRSGDSAAVWGQAALIGNLARLETAVEQLRKMLDGQRVLWVEGRHLPQSINKSPSAPNGFEVVR